MMKEQVFVDTGGWFAVLVGDDKFSKLAVPQYRLLVEAEAELITSNYVVAEVITLLRRHASWPAFHKLANQFKRIIGEGYVSLVNIGSRYDSPLHDAFMHWFGEFPRERLSYTDCVSFEIMRRLDIRNAFAFDRHFQKAGFRLIPGLP